MDRDDRFPGTDGPAADNPPVTFCLLAFNQELFVETAMRAAFAQTYSNLEIIVSDDGSSDGTWDRVQSLAAAYDGPHRVRVRRSPVNRGVLHHLLDVAELASGRLLVVGAADDISLPQRTEIMVDAWRRHDYAAAFTDYAIVDDTGRVLEEHYHFDDSRFSPGDYLPGVDAPNIHGASSVYDVERLKSLGRPAADEIVSFEDTWLSLAFVFSGFRVEHVPEVTVKYRRHTGSITNFGDSSEMDLQTMERLQRKWQQHSAAFGATLASFRAWHGRRGQQQEVLPLSGRIDTDIAYFDRVGRWEGMGVLSRGMTLRFASRRWMMQAAGLRIAPVTAQFVLRRLRKLFRAYGVRK